MKTIECIRCGKPVKLIIKKVKGKTILEWNVCNCNYLMSDEELNKQILIELIKKYI